MSRTLGLSPRVEHRAHNSNTMRFQDYITEKRKNNVIVVDIQPIYKSGIHFDMGKFTDFLMEQGNILYYFNGPDTVGGDSKKEIINWLYEESDYNDDLYNKLNSKQTLWYDKGYGFFRGWMDNGASDRFIKKAIRFMMSKKENDSRDIEPEVWEEKFPKDWKDAYEVDMIYLPDIPINTLKKWSGSYLVGGGKNECLLEIQILMSTFNIKHKDVRQFIY